MPHPLVATGPQCQRLGVLLIAGQHDPELFDRGRTVAQLDVRMGAADAGVDIFRIQGDRAFVGDHRTAEIPQCDPRQGQRIVRHRIVRIQADRRIQVADRRGVPTFLDLGQRAW